MQVKFVRLYLANGTWHSKTVGACADRTYGVPLDTLSEVCGSVMFPKAVVRFLAQSVLLCSRGQRH